MRTPTNKKTNNIPAGLQTIMLYDNYEDGLGRYKEEMMAMGIEDTDLITRTRAVVSNAPEAE